MDSDKRRCKHPTCTTILHSRHKGEYCYVHEDTNYDTTEDLSMNAMTYTRGYHGAVNHESED